LGSGLSSIGGSIRLTELTKNQPIRHALKLISGKIPTTPMLFQGIVGLPTLPTATPLINITALTPNWCRDAPGEFPVRLKLQTPAGKKLFQALQNGAYVADDAGWDTHFCMEKGLRSSAPLMVMIFRAPMAGLPGLDEAIQSAYCR